MGKEKKRSVLACVVAAGNVDRTADGVAEIVPAQRRTLNAAGIIEEVVCLEDIIAEKFVGIAVEGTSSRFCHHIDLRGGGATEFGVVLSPQDLEFFDSVHARIVQNRLV